MSTHVTEINESTLSFVNDQIYYYNWLLGRVKFIFNEFWFPKKGKEKK